MFGYVTADFSKLSEEEKTAYNSYYCGLCKSLSDNYGITGSFALTYDMTFLILVLTSVYDEKAVADFTKCRLHPLKPRPVLVSEFTDYAADLSIILSYYNYLDDWNDDRNYAAHVKTKLFSDKFAIAAKKYPEKNKAVKSNLEELTKIEAHGDINPDSGANCFGNIMRVVFNYQNDEFSEALSDFGYWLGKFIYIMDASIDFRRDVKAKKYNPLVAVSSASHEEILNMIMAGCEEAFNRLPIQENRSLIENIMYSGVWREFYLRKKNRNENKG